VLLLDKPAGPTSHDVVSAVRRALGVRRVGHAGTLDPAASGLLVVLVGRATRLARFIATLPKHYTGTIRFGWETVTDDGAGERASEPDETWRSLSREQLEAALQRVRAQPTQVPPAVSAKKVAGERAYRLARRGAAPAMAPAAVTIHRLELAACDLAAGEAVVNVVCSTGTYVRAIARDVGRALETRAHLAALRRTAIGPWRLSDAVPLDAALSETAPRALRPMLEAVAHLPRLLLGEEDARRFSHGMKLDAMGRGDGIVAAFAGAELLGVAELEAGRYAPAVVLAA
jgi:tRNA pseudouridine55 synthase